MPLSVVTVRHAVGTPVHLQIVEATAGADSIALRHSHTRRHDQQHSSTNPHNAANHSTRAEKRLDTAARKHHRKDRKAIRLLTLSSEGGPTTAGEQLGPQEGAQALKAQTAPREKIAIPKTTVRQVMFPEMARTDN